MLEQSIILLHEETQENPFTKKTKTEGYFLRYFIEQIADTIGYVMPIAL